MTQYPTSAECKWPPPGGRTSRGWIILELRRKRIAAILDQYHTSYHPANEIMYISISALASQKIWLQINKSRFIKLQNKWNVWHFSTNDLKGYAKQIISSRVFSLSGRHRRCVVFAAARAPQEPTEKPKTKTNPPHRKLEVRKTKTNPGETS